MSVEQSPHFIVTAIKAFSDNYIWCITGTEPENHHFATLVDPGDSAACIRYIEENSLILKRILITHHHKDHVGGINDLRSYCQNKGWAIDVFGPSLEATEFSDTCLKEADTVVLDELNAEARVMDIPGHTMGHIAYIMEDALFCGDTLFSGGCGRIFEGTPEQMQQSLLKLAKLPNTTQVYCAHEYTLANLSFALTVDPENIDLINYYNQATSMRENNIATIPTTIDREKRINPFLRSHEQSIQESAALYGETEIDSALQAFTLIREWKNNF